MFRILGSASPKYRIALWTYISSRKCLRLCQIGIFFIVVFGLYLSTFYYSVDNDKVPPQEFLNDSVLGCSETGVLVNTENNNIVIQNQQSAQTYEERPILFNETVTVSQSLKIGNISTNCGLPRSCGNEEFAVHLYTGKNLLDEPKLCVDGKYILTKSINDGGRGINVVVIDSLMKMVITVANFDTYEKDSTPLEVLLLTLRPGDIVILMTFDEPSRKLSRIARLLLFDLGSAFIQNLSYRGSWYLITQKGISGFSPYEELNFVESSGWPHHHDVRLCIPFNIEGQVIHPDPPVSSNPKRVQFCEKNNDLPLFCDADVVNDLLIPSPVWKQAAAINKIYEVPIIVMSGKDTQFLPLTLETLIRQPGVKPTFVVVYHLEDDKMVQNLTDLFGFMSEELLSSSTYCGYVAEAFERTTLFFPDAQNIIFIGENAILAPDFMYYMGQLLSVLNLDPSVLAVSALNENGFKSVSGDPTLAYRSETFSAAAILVRKNFFKSHWCERNHITDPLVISTYIEGDVVVPDVSRLSLAAPLSHVRESSDLSNVFFTHDRTITFEQNIALKSVEKLFLEEYQKELETLLSAAVPLEFDSESLRLCLGVNEKSVNDLHQLPVVRNATKSHSLIIYFFQEHDKDFSTLQFITQCLNLFYHPSFPVRGMYKGVLRFLLQEDSAFLISTKSPFFHLKSELVPVLQYNHHLHDLIHIVL